MSLKYMRENKHACVLKSWFINLYIEKKSLKKVLKVIYAIATVIKFNNLILLKVLQCVSVRSDYM